MEKNYYEILGIQPTATPEEIRKAYREKMKENHPDIHQDSDTYTERAKLINEAYSTLKDPEKRKQYDRKVKPQTTYRTYQKNKTYQKSSPNKNDKTDNSKTDSLYEDLKQDYFKKTKEFLDKLTSSTINNDILSVNKNYLEYINSKQKYENYLSFSLNFKQRLVSILSELLKIWNTYGDIKMLFIKNELITMLRKTLNISTIKDLEPLLEIYLALDKSIDRFQINSYSYVIKKLFETESILKNFADILQKHGFDYKNIDYYNIDYFKNFKDKKYKF